jgi:abortive infection bacteriophage resistance protein
MCKVPYTKPPLSYSEQIQLLKSRGLEIENEPKALHLLEVISYYRLSGYWYPMLSDKENHIFKPNSTFETAYCIYKFDRELRLLILSELEKIEIGFRAKMIYELSHSYGVFWYTDPLNFQNQKKYSETFAKICTEYDRSDEDFIKSYKNKYSDSMPPSWMMFEFSSFGILSSLYSNLLPGRGRRTVAKYFGLSDNVMESWVHSLVYLRNICAHHSRLWNKKMRIPPIIPRSPNNSFIIQTSYTCPDTGISLNLNKKTYFILSMIIYLMNVINPKNSVSSKVKSLLEKYPNIDTRAMGFPDSWQTESLWK